MPRPPKKKTPKTLEEVTADLLSARTREEECLAKVTALESRANAKKASITSAKAALGRAAVQVKTLAGLLAELKEPAPLRPNSTKVMSSSATNVSNLPTITTNASISPTIVAHALSSSIIATNATAVSTNTAAVSTVDSTVETTSVKGTNSIATRPGVVSPPDVEMSDVPRVDASGVAAANASGLTNANTPGLVVIVPSDPSGGSDDTKTPEVKANSLLPLPPTTTHNANDASIAPTKPVGTSVNTSSSPPSPLASLPPSTTAFKASTGVEVEPSGMDVDKLPISVPLSPGTSPDATVIPDDKSELDQSETESSGPRAGDKRRRFDSDGESEVDEPADEEEETTKVDSREKEGKEDKNKNKNKANKVKVPRMRFHASFSTHPLFVWRGTPEDKAVANALYLQYIPLYKILRTKYEELTPEKMERYLSVAQMLIRLWGYAANPWDIPGLKIPYAFRDALLHHQHLLPMSGCTSIDLTEQILTTCQGTMKCKGCYKKAIRSDESIAKRVETRAENKRVKLEKEEVDLSLFLPAPTTSKPAKKRTTKKETAPPPVEPLSVTGDYGDYCGQTVDGVEWVLDCGCSFEMACWSFFMWKTWDGVHMETGIAEPTPIMVSDAREPTIQNFSAFTGLRIGKLMNWRATGFWDLKNQIRICKLQVERLTKVIDGMEEIQKAKKKWVGQCWPEVDGQVDVQQTLTLHRKCYQ